MENTLLHGEKVIADHGIRISGGMTEYQTLIHERAADTPFPLFSVFVEFAVEQGDNRFDRLLLVFSRGFDRDGGTEIGAKHHDMKDAFCIGAGRILG